MLIRWGGKPKKYLNKNTTVDWSMYMREVCASYMLKHQGQIGGVGLTVEIDEALFTKRKNHSGRVLPEQWVFGGICRETRECFMVAVPNRTAKTLLTVVREKIAPNSTVMSDCWRSYNMVSV